VSLCRDREQFVEERGQVIQKSLEDRLLEFRTFGEVADKERGFIGAMGSERSGEEGGCGRGQGW
jgi:hypothetical protein